MIGLSPTVTVSDPKLFREPSLPLPAKPLTALTSIALRLGNLQYNNLKCLILFCKNHLGFKFTSRGFVLDHFLFSLCKFMLQEQCYNIYGLILIFFPWKINLMAFLCRKMIFRDKFSI